MARKPSRAEPAREAERLRRAVAAREERKLRARQEKHRTVWFGLGMFGLVGWSVAIPTLAGIALGVWLDSDPRWGGRYSWTLTFLGLGVALGCLNAWFWLTRERRDIERRR